MLNTWSTIYVQKINARIPEKVANEKIQRAITKQTKLTPLNARLDINVNQFFKFEEI